MPVIIILINNAAQGRESAAGEGSGASERWLQNQACNVLEQGYSWGAAGGLQSHPRQATIKSGVGEGWPPPLFFSSS